MSAAGREPGTDGDELPAEALQPEDLLATSDAGPAAIRGGSMRMVGFGVGTLVAAAAAALLFRHLGRAQTGRYIVAQSLVAIVAGVSDLGLTAIALRELSLREGADRHRFAANMLGLRLLVTGIGLVAIIAFTAVAGYGGGLVLGVTLAGIGLVFQSVQSTMATSLMSRLRLGWVTAADILRQVVNSLLLVLLVAAGAGVVPALAAAIPSSLAALVLTLVLVRGDMPLRPAFDRREFRALLVVVLPFSAAVAAATIYVRLAVVLVSLAVSADASGDFGLSARILETLVAVPSLLVGAAFPIFSRAARDDHERLAYGVQRVFVVTLIVGAGVGVALVLGAPIAVRVIGGHQFPGATSILQLQALGMAASFVDAVWMYAMLGLGLYRDILRVNAGLLIFGGALVGVGVAVDGTHGAAIATSVAEVGLTAALAIVLTRRNPALRPNLRPLLPVGVACVVGLVPPLVLGLGAVPRTAVGVALFAAAILILRVVPDEVFHELRRLRAQRGAAAVPPPSASG